MKDFRKRCQPNGIDSVLGKLMGFEQLRPQQPVRGKQRGLSDDYVRKAASVGLRPRSLIYIGRSGSTNNDKVHEECVNSSTSKVKMGIISPKVAGSSASKSLSGAVYHDRRLFVKKDNHCAPGSDRRYVQKLERGSLGGHPGELGIDYMDKSLKLKSEKETYDSEDVKLNAHFGSVYRGHREFLRPERSKDHHDIVCKELLVDGFVSPRRSCIACSPTMNRILGQEKRRSKFEELIRQGYMGNNYKDNDVEVALSCPGVNDYTNYIHDESLLTSESKRQNFGRWKAAGEVQEVGYEMLALVDKKSMLRNLNTRLHINGLCSVSSIQSRSSDSSSPSVFSSINASEDNYLESSSVSEFETISETLSSGLNLRQDESTSSNNKSKEQTISEEDTLELKDGRIYDQLIQDKMDKGSGNDTYGEIELSATVSESMSSNLPSKYINDDTYASAEAFDIEASLNEFSEEESVSSNSKKTNQHSPHSVLEPFHVQNSSTFEYLDSIGLRLQLQALNFETEETYSEESVMFISGGEDIEESFGDLSHDAGKVKRWLGDNESRNFSYMVDVLDEAGYCGMQPSIDFKGWDSLDCPISPFVFEALEKKYGKQTSWQKSERQLLFDRINSGLLDIFNPIINFHAYESSIRRWICAALRRDEVEDELWMMLIRQENDKSKDLSEKAIGKWLEFEEGMDIICRDLETSLFDELVMELASLCD